MILSTIKGKIPSYLKVAIIYIFIELIAIAIGVILINKVPAKVALLISLPTLVWIYIMSVTGGEMIEREEKNADM